MSNGRVTKYAVTAYDRHNVTNKFVTKGENLTREELGKFIGIKGGDLTAAIEQCYWKDASHEYKIKEQV